MGGARALAALGVRPTVWHMNEGTRRSFPLERLRESCCTRRSQDSALRRVAANTCSRRTHAPSRRNETYDDAVIRKYLRRALRQVGLEVDQLLAWAVPETTRTTAGST